MAETRSAAADPGQLDGEPFEVARKAVEDLASALAEVAAQFEAVERQLRNARMTDALELSPLELAASYPEAVDADGFIEGVVLGDGGGIRPHEDPYEFWEATEDAALATRIAGALRVAAELVDRLKETQPASE